MNKILLTLFIILSTTSFSLNQVFQEQGMSGLEISSFINYSSKKHYNLKQNNLDEKYFIINSINNNLYRKLEITNFDKGKNLNLSINRLMNSNGYIAHNFDLLGDIQVNQFWKIGINLSYADLRNTATNLFQGNLFSKWSNGDDITFISSIFGGTSKENKSNRKNYYGITNKFQKEYLSFNEVSYLPYLKLDYSKLSKNKNLYTELGFGISKIIYEDYIDFDKFITPKVTFGFGHEFLENDKYNDLGKDEFSSLLFIKAELPIKFNVIEVNPVVSFGKSIVNSNFETTAGINFKYSF
jgi:hypothetical protein